MFEFDLNNVRVPKAPAAKPEAAGLAVCPFQIVVDSREQLPFSFSGLGVVVPTVVKGLPSGDYSIEGMEELIAVERKSAADIVGSVCAGHTRFEREHHRMLNMVENGGYVALVCEGNYAEIDDGLRSEDRMQAANTLLGTMTSWPCKFRCPWYFAGDRRRAEIITFHLLSKWYRLVMDSKWQGRAG
jgi:ERCC4-type nuclease